MNLSEPEYDFAFASLSQLAMIPADIWQKSKSLFYVRRFKPQEYFQLKDQYASEIAFVVKGLFRSYFESGDKKQMGISFAQEGQFIGAYSSYLSKAPTRVNIVAEQNCEVICIRCEDIEMLYQLHPCWLQIGRKLTEEIAKTNENRQYELMVLSATQRYEQFLKDFPKLKEQIPQWQIASYLGITPVALSRIRRQRVC